MLVTMENPLQPPVIAGAGHDLPHCSSRPRAISASAWNDSWELNNSAVVLLQAKRFDEALSVLRDAWNRQGLRDNVYYPTYEQLWAPTLLSAETLDEVVRNLHSNACDARETSITSVPIDGLPNTVGIPRNQDLDSSPSNYFSLYDRAFRFKDERPGSLRWVHRMRLLPAVILFNLAVTYHRRAVTQVSSEEYELAFEAYRMSLDIVEQNMSTALYASDYNLLQLAIYNNMGFINSHFFHEDSAMICAGRLLATFAAMDCSRLLSKEEYVFYYMNLLFLLNRNPVFAPAA